ncbi:TetR/AcrR family transcriptional regulator [Paenibacillus sp. N1-5-1-14]|uniref:TetR/AcrR family transcriptional regulator n=1 Tax=Paenibacillus radicibacter TaxID=2972488 RepID=UPI002159B549|nr:TetR/AcrR family transcriptional regulator [Paenibacillus radicibacter]MCR8642083.1 TetR/AcrR family transcriptional regulator [Paenibacillus radicibacter]
MSRKKQQVLEKGCQLFFEKGIRETSMDDVAEAVPVSKMTIYKYFQNKEGLIEEVCEKVAREHHMHMRAIFESSDDMIEIISKLSCEKQLRTKYEAFFQGLMTEYPLLLKKTMDYQRDHMMPDFELFIFRAQQKGTIRKDIAPQMIMMFMACINEFITKMMSSEGIHQAQNAADQMMNLLCYGIVAPEHQREQESNS